MSYDISQNDTFKRFKSPDCNYLFNKKTGKMLTWGKTLEDNPAYAPFPFILDIEVSSICKGPTDQSGLNKLCPFCYKANTSKGHNMSLDEFKTIIDKMPGLTQVAFGSGSTGIENPDIFDMLEYTRSKGIIPNITVSDISDDTAIKLSKVCGAVAVSFYSHVGFETGIKTVERLKNAGMKYVNIHFMLSKDTVDDAFALGAIVKTDPRLSDITAIVFLALKQKGRGTKLDSVSFDEYTSLVDYCLENKLPFGFDSCSAPIFLKAVKQSPDFDKYYTLSEDCESTLFSAYINEQGKFYPCSFTEKWIEGGWLNGIDVLSANDFIEDVWNHPKTRSFRDRLTNNTTTINNIKCRNCPAYTICVVE
jgi:radical SAM protein with 4Fe4S-binding SPASM domain